MVTYLNQTDPEKLKEWLADSSESLEVRFASFQATPAEDFAKVSKHAFWLTSINKELAVYRYLLRESHASIATPLAAAARWITTMLAAKAKGKLPGNNVWTLHLGDVAIVTAFGTPRERTALSGIPLEACVADSERTSVGARTTLIWHELLGTGVLAERAAQSALSDAEAENADRWDRQWCHGILRALLGVSTRNVEELNAGLDEVLAFQRYLATRGGWELRDDGVLSWAALGLMRLGLEAGLPITVSSDYAPLALLREERS